MTSSSKTKEPTLWFLLALVAGFFVLLNGITWFVMLGFLPTVMFEEFMMLASLPFLIFGILAILFAVGIFVGALFIYRYKNKTVGGIIVLVFSLLSISTGGGFFIGFVLGAISGFFIIWQK
jgi:hypothetical protein